MPPQQSDRLLDLFDDAFNFGAHENSGLRRWPLFNRREDVAADEGGRNRLVSIAFS
jgi:hypothetical protein